MGNSLRGYLGNLCGTEESKRAHTEICDERQPKEQFQNSGEPAVGADTVKGKTGDQESGCKEKVDETATIEPEDIPEVLEEDEGEKTQENLPLIPTVKRTLLFGILNFSTPRFETFGIGELDQKFEGAHTILSNFVESLQVFKVNIQDFSKLYKKKEFEVALTLHQEICSKEGEGKGSEHESKAKVGSEDFTKGNSLLLKAKEQYPTVSKKILDTKEKLKGLAKDVESVSIKDYVRDEMGDKGFLSRVSVPGKYRRNAKTIRKKMKLLDECAVELDDWYSRSATVGRFDPQTSKPDLLGDVKELEESPGVARHKKVAEKQDTEEHTDEVTCSVMMPIAMTNVIIRESEIPEQQSLCDADAKTPATQEAAVIHGGQIHARDRTDEATGDSKSIIVEENYIAETRIVEEATPNILVVVDDALASERIHEGTPIPALEQPVVEAEEKSTPVDAERETSPVPEENKETKKDKKKEGKKTETSVSGSSKAEKPKEVKDSAVKEKEVPVQATSARIKPVQSSNAKKTPVEPLGPKSPSGSSKTPDEATKTSVEAKTTPIEAKKITTATKTTSSQARKMPIEARVVGNPANTPEKTLKTEESDQVGVLPVMPGSSKLERQVSSASGDLQDGKLTDYGSYLVLTDDQELLKRSRSLDSLTSRGSRQSISRLGSFEIVTNFELMMAEQAETEKRKHMSDSQKSL